MDKKQDAKYPAAPEGWKLVPVEPTEEMMGAAMQAHEDKPLTDWGKIVPANDDEIYRAMLAASPAAPAQSAEPVASARIGTVDVIAGRVRSYTFEQTDTPDGSYSLYAAPQPPQSAEGGEAIFTPEQMATLFVALGNFESSGSKKCAASIRSILEMHCGDVTATPAQSGEPVAWLGEGNYYTSDAAIAAKFGYLMPVYAAPQPSRTAVELDDERAAESFEDWFDREYPVEYGGNRPKFQMTPVMELMRAAWQARAASIKPVSVDERETFEAKFGTMSGVAWDGTDYVVLPAWKNDSLCNRFIDYWTAWQARAASPQPVKLTDSEQYIGQMAGISTAALGYWKEGDSIHPSLDTVALRDVAKLYAKYAALHDQANSPQPVEQTRALTDEQRAKMIADLEAEQTFISSSRERCDPNYELPRWDRLQAIIDHLAGGA